MIATYNTPINSNSHELISFIRKCVNESLFNITQRWETYFPALKFQLNIPEAQTEA